MELEREATRFTRTRPRAATPRRAARDRSHSRKSDPKSDTFLSGSKGNSSINNFEAISNRRRLTHFDIVSTSFLYRFRRGGVYVRVRKYWWTLPKRKIAALKRVNLYLIVGKTTFLELVLKLIQFKGYSIAREFRLSHWPMRTLPASIVSLRPPGA